MNNEVDWVFRLRGELGGRLRVIELPPGAASVGAAPDNTVILDVASVSRRHALLEVQGETVLVQDAGSKNGTFINGVRVTEGAVSAGDRLAFGPVQFEIERVDPTDAQLAIAIDQRQHTPLGRRTPPSTDTHDARREHRPGAWMATLSTLANNLLGDHDAVPSQALAALCEGVGSPGALFFRGAGAGEATSLAAWGDELDPDRRAPLQRAIALAAGAAESTPVLLAGRDGGPPPLIWAVLARPGEAPWGLLVSGGFDHWEQAEPLAEVVLRMLVHAQPEPIHLSPDAPATKPPRLVVPEGHVVGRSPVATSLYEELKLLVAADLPVLVEGETGVGKEHVARILHLSSPRSGKPFVAVNCAAIPAELLEAELFGIEKGIATGVMAREGKFRQAHGGVLVLDEVAEMPLSLQPKLLRALQEGEISPVGARAPVQVNVRVIAMTNTDLLGRVREGRFRHDLYFRLNGYRLWVPALRHRRADIPLLVEHFLRRFAREVGKPLRGLSVKALRALVQAPWEGNVRELEHEVRRLVYLCPQGQTIDSSLLSPEILHPTLAQHPRELEAAPDLTLERQVEALERRLITIALARAKGNRSKAAKLLGISRNGLAGKLERLRGNGLAP